MLPRSFRDEDAAVTHLLCHSGSKRYQGKEQMCVLGYYLHPFTVLSKISFCSRPYVMKYINIPDSQTRTQIIPAKIMQKTTTRNPSNINFKTILLNHQSVRLSRCLPSSFCKHLQSYKVGEHLTLVSFWYYQP